MLANGENFKAENQKVDSVCSKFAVKTNETMRDINSAKIITVRINDEKDKQILQRIIKETGCNQMSRALMKTAEGYVRLCELSRKQIEENNRLRRELEMYRKYAEIVINTGKAMQSFKEQQKKLDEKGKEGTQTNILVDNSHQ